MCQMLLKWSFGSWKDFDFLWGDLLPTWTLVSFEIRENEKRVETPAISIVSFEPFIQARSWPSWRRGENVMLERLLASTNILSIPRRNGRWKMMGLESGISRDIWMQDAAPRLWLPVPIRFLLYSINFSSLYSFLHFYLSIQISTKFIWCYLATWLYMPL